VERLEHYARSFNAPVREHTPVTSVELDSDGEHFRVNTKNAVYRSPQVVLATGALQKTKIPAYAGDFPARIMQMEPSGYRNPSALRPGSVLIVGSGQTGCQIAEELCRAGRTVYLSIGRCWWVPRRYRERDIAFWFRFAGYMDQSVDDLPPGSRTGKVNPQMSGGDGGHDISLYTLAAEGVVLLGRIQRVQDGMLFLAPDLSANLEWGDEQAFELLRTIDAKILAEGFDAPEPEQSLEEYRRSTDDLAKGSPAELDLAVAGVGTVIWATGYQPDFSWVKVPILAEDGYPNHRRGVTEVSGLYILGLDWLYKLKSGIFAGVGEDAEYLAGFIAARAASAHQPLLSASTS
jgi:putative flavoprotein involved in K+ transport